MKKKITVPTSLASDARPGRDNVKHSLQQVSDRLADLSKLLNQLLDRPLDGEIGLLPQEHNRVLMNLRTRTESVLHRVDHMVELSKPLMPE